MPSFEHIQEEIANMLAIPDEELDEEQRQLMDAYLNELAGQESSKVDGFAQFIKIQTAYADACREEAKRLAAKADIASRRLDWLKNSYLQTMQTHGIRKIVGNAYSLSIRETEAVDVLDLEALKKANPALVKTRITENPDKMAIKAAIKAGGVIPGAELVKRASLQVR